MPFEVQFSSAAQRDLTRLDRDTQRLIVETSLTLKTSPFPAGTRRKRIHGLPFPCYRLRIDTASDTFRLFYGIHQGTVYVLRIVARREADRIIRRLRGSAIPPE